jgi:hypothetical protein
MKPISIPVRPKIRTKCVMLMYRWTMLAAAGLIIACTSLVGNVAAESNADPGIARQNEPVPGEKGVADSASPRTPLAGEAYTTTLWGETIKIPARNRENERAVTLGGNFYAPSVGDAFGEPIGALYWRHKWEKWWTRATVGVFVNEVDVARSFGQFQLLGHFDNNTIPFADVDVQDGKKVNSSSVLWGTITGWLGAGIRIPVAPCQPENDLRLQLFYQGGYFYNGRTKDTGSDVQLPPDTFFHGIRFRARYDGLQRNIMELPHEGWAAGGDLEWTRRDNWSNETIGGMTFTQAETQDYLKLSSYLIGATGIPYLSERHRFVGYLHAGFSPVGKLDRFSAFRVGSGPFPYESYDLYRVPYPGAFYNSFPVTDYVIATLEYRLELLFFMYLHLRGTFAWGANRPDFSSDGLNLRLSSTDSEAFSVGLTSGFFKDSQLYLEYAYDTKLLRNGIGGSSFTVLWSKSF